MNNSDNNVNRNDSRNAYRKPDEVNTYVRRQPDAQRRVGTAKNTAAPVNNVPEQAKPYRPSRTVQEKPENGNKEINKKAVIGSKASQNNKSQKKTPEKRPPRKPAPSEMTPEMIRAEKRKAAKKENVYEKSRQSQCYYAGCCCCFSEYCNCCNFLCQRYSRYPYPGKKKHRSFCCYL